MLQTRYGQVFQGEDGRIRLPNQNLVEVMGKERPGCGCCQFEMKHQKVRNGATGTNGKMAIELLPKAQLTLLAMRS